MQNCKNCKHWCYIPESTQKHCDFINTIQGERASKIGAGLDIEAYAKDDTCLTVFAITGPDFGCVNFESKKDC